MTIPCCWTEESSDGAVLDCKKSRHGSTPMCSRHLRWTMIDAINAGDLSDEVFRYLIEHSKEAAAVASEVQHTIADGDARSAKRRQTLEKQSVVYYVNDGDSIKIGTTTNLRSRLLALRIPESDLLATEPGGPKLERKRHAQFAHLRRGRWERFEPTSDLLAHVLTVRKEHGEPQITTYPKMVC